MIFTAVIFCLPWNKVLFFDLKPRFGAFFVYRHGDFERLGFRQNRAISVSRFLQNVPRGTIYS
jgi:hypothetical protein